MREINASGYRGEVTNRGRIGLADGGYKELWDTLHPDDPLELPVARAAERDAVAVAATTVVAMAAAAVAAEGDGASDEATASVVASGTM